MTHWTVDIAKTADGHAEARREWKADQAWASALLVHGIGEHSGRYQHVAKQMVGSGINVAAIDLRGFGNTDGKRAYVTSVDDYLGQIQGGLERIGEFGTPTVLIGHSMGGLLSLNYALSDRPAPDLLVLSAPALDAAVTPWKRLLTPYLAKVLPKLSIPLDISGEQLSRDPKVGEAYFADDLVQTSSTTGLGAVLLSTMAATQKACAALKIPTLVLHGQDDELVPVSFTERLSGVPAVERRTKPGLRHEMFNEPEGPEIVAEMVDWIRSQVASL
ncbi:MAG: lysophospholipase [Acidimicrobiia bacterium]|nr:lysophospholipase [Acidimicrobiia bacterium]MBP8180248.1 lysophospholipase [Acidimicrobiia bacterium]